MNRLLLFVLFNTRTLSLCLTGATVEEEILATDIMRKLSDDTCDHHAQAIQLFCCASQQILGVFERLAGLNTIHLCQIYVTACRNDYCGFKCVTLTCADPKEEDNKLEQLIQSRLYSDQQLLVMMLSDLFLAQDISKHDIQAKNEQGEDQHKDKRGTLKTIASFLKKRASNILTKKIFKFGQFLL